MHVFYYDNNSTRIHTLRCVGCVITTIIITGSNGNVDAVILMLCSVAVVGMLGMQRQRVEITVIVILRQVHVFIMISVKLLCKDFKGFFGV